MVFFGGVLFYIVGPFTLNAILICTSIIHKLQIAKFLTYFQSMYKTSITFFFGKKTSITLTDEKYDLVVPLVVLMTHEK